MTRVYTIALFLSALTAAQLWPADDEHPILTPPPPVEAKINGPTVYGARPGHPFLYRIPCTGERPVRFAAQGLPASLHLDSHTGIITGRTPDKPGVYAVTLRAANSKGKASRPLRIAVGETLALTPPMGWNTWYTDYGFPTDRKVRQAADIMISSGMANFGYQYVQIDSGWAVNPESKDPELNGPQRDSHGTILPNKRFPDMAALAAYIHDKGLKAGVYSSPGPLACGGTTGSYQHEESDARTFAAWEFDYLKYDYCSYLLLVPNPTIAQQRKPYDLMGGILKKQDRDIIFNVNWAGEEIATWAADAGGNSWRIADDIGVAKGSRLPGFYTVAFADPARPSRYVGPGHWDAGLSSYAGPGHWNDPDYILIGAIDDPDHPVTPVPAALTADEQYSYMSMWALMAAPLIFGGDMAQLDEFTLAILCNSEVIEIDQDALGWQARVVRHSADEFILEKLLEDGSVAVGLFNLSERSRKITASLTDLGLKGSWKARDLWRQKEIGAVASEFSSAVPRHGVILVRLSSWKGK